MPDRKDLPPADSPMFLSRVREMVQAFLGRSGDRLDQVVTVRDLDEAGIAAPHKRFIATGGGVVLTDPTPDLTTPPTPTGFQATSGTSNILFQTDQPTFRVGHGYARTVVYVANWDGVSPLPTFADAVEYYTFRGPIASAPFDPAANVRLWARWVSVDGAFSVPAGGTNGIAAQTGLVDDFQIANLSVAKLLAGALSVGQYIESSDYVANTSGWRIQTLGDGSAFMEVNGGAIIGGATIGPTYVQSSNYVLDTTGWRLNSDGTGQIGAFTVTNSGIESTNFDPLGTGWQFLKDGTGQIGGLVVGTNYIQSQGYVAGTTGFRLSYNGDFSSPELNLSGGTATFTGELQSSNYVQDTSGWKVSQSAMYQSFGVDIMAEFNGVVVSRPQVVASGTEAITTITWDSTQFETDQTQSLFIDSGYDDFAQIFDVKRPALIGKAAVTNGTITFTTDPGSSKVADLAVAVRNHASFEFFKTGSSPVIPGGRILLELIFRAPQNVPSGIVSINITEAKWALLRVT